MFICFFLSSFLVLACRPTELIFKYFVNTWELMASGSSQCALTFSAGGHVAAWGQDFMKCMAKIVTHYILETVRPRAKGCKIRTEHPQCACRLDSYYEVWPKPEGV